MATFNLVLDLFGTFVFALSGAMKGVRHRLDIFGILVVSFVAGNSGGIIRDVVIGATPPLAINEWRYLAVSVFAGFVTYFYCPVINRLRSPVQLFDALGLALFAVTGTNKALVYDLNPVAAVMLGMLTGIGGGMARDILTAEIPTVLHSDLYAVAALAGSTALVILHKLHFPPGTATMAGAALCFGLRFVAIRRKWQLPTAGKPNDDGKQ